MGTVEEFPTPAVVKHHGSLGATLMHMTEEFQAYTGAYVLVAILWYVNHTIIHLFHTIDTVTLFLQKLFLAWTALVLQQAQLFNKYGREKTVKSQQALIIGSTIFLIASLTNLGLWCWGTYKKEKLLEVWAIRTGRVRKKGVYVFLKTIIAPSWYLLQLVCTAASPVAGYYTRYICFFGMLFSFVFAKVAFVCTVGKEYHNGGVEGERSTATAVEMKDNAGYETG